MKEAFSLFAIGPNGPETTISARKVPTLLRALGVNPTEEELAAMLKGKEDAALSYQDFSNMAKPHVEKVDPLEQLIKAFKNFDRDNNGTINANELRHVLLNLGEKLTNEDVDEILKLAEARDGNIQYATFAQKLVGRTK